jgi:hypothetical protein
MRIMFETGKSIEERKMKRTQLPAVINDAPLQFALEQLKRYLSAPNPWSPMSMMSDDAGQAFTRNIYQLMLEWPQGRMALTKAALNGDASAYEVLRTVLLECDSRRVEPPPELITYRMQLINEERTLHPGVKKEKRIMRDVCIMATVADTARAFPHLSLTGRSARHRSICETVAQALSILERPISRKGVERIWENLRGAWPKWITGEAE